MKLYREKENAPEKCEAFFRCVEGTRKRNISFCGAERFVLIFRTFRFADYNGWYVNAQSDTGQKYMQLVSIQRQLGIAMEVEIGTDFITSDAKVAQKSKKKDDKLLVKFPNGEYAAGENPIDTLIEAVWQIGPEKIKRKELEFKGKPIITLSKQFNGQVQVGQNFWLTVPSQTKEKYMMLCSINAMMKLGLEVSII